MYILTWTIGTEEIVVLSVIVLIVAFFGIVFSRLLKRKWWCETKVLFWQFMSRKPRRSFSFFTSKKEQKNRRCFSLNPYWIVQKASIYILNKKEATTAVKEGLVLSDHPARKRAPLQRRGIAEANRINRRKWLRGLNRPCMVSWPALCRLFR